MFKYFESFKGLVDTAVEFKDCLTQCIRCKLIWISHETLKALEKGTKFISQEDWELLQKCVMDLNTWEPDVKELAAAGIFISHGLCHPCIRDRLISLVRPKQAKSGYRPCFGTAINGHCSEDGTNGRPLCDHYCVCVVNEQELSLWEQRLHIEKAAPSPMYVN